MQLWGFSAWASLFTPWDCFHFFYKIFFFFFGVVSFSICGSRVWYSKGLSEDFYTFLCPVLIPKERFIVTYFCCIYLWTEQRFWVLKAFLCKRFLIYCDGATIEKVKSVLFFRRWFLCDECTSVCWSVLLTSTNLVYLASAAKLVSPIKVHSEMKQKEQRPAVSVSLFCILTVLKALMCDCTKYTKGFKQSRNYVGAKICIFCRKCRFETHFTHWKRLW